MQQWRTIFSGCSCTAAASTEDGWPVPRPRRLQSSTNNNLINVSPVPASAQLLPHLTLSDDHKQELREAFQLFDVDGDGSISVEEIGMLLRKFNIKLGLSQMQLMVEKVDRNADGQIQFDEFYQLMTSPDATEMTFENELLEAFKVFDRDGDGYIDALELMCVLTSIGETATDEEVTTMISEADLNGDGKMDWDEFVKIMMY